MPYGAIIGGVIAGGASIYGASQQSKSAGKATQVEMDMFNRTQGNLEPWMQAGQTSLDELMGLLGMQAPAPSAPFTPGMPSSSGNKGGIYGTLNTLGDPLGISKSLGLPNSLTGFGTLGSLFKQSRPAIQDIAGALQQGNPITDAAWTKAGFGAKGAGLNGGPGFFQLHPEYGQFASLYGQQAPGAAPAPPTNPTDILKNSPGYQFRLNQGLEALGNSGSARGGAFSGNMMKAISDYGQGTASDEYWKLINALMQMSSSGQNAAANLGGFGANVASNVGSNIIGAGNANAAGIVGAGNAITNSLPYLINRGGGFGGGGFGGGGSSGGGFGGSGFSDLPTFA